MKPRKRKNTTRAWLGSRYPDWLAGEIIEFVKMRLKQVRDIRDLSTRANTVIKSAMSAMGITSVDDIGTMKIEDIRKVRGCGPKTIDEIERWLNEEKGA